MPVSHITSTHITYPKRSQNKGQVTVLCNGGLKTGDMGLSPNSTTDKLQVHHTGTWGFVAK